MPTLKPSQIVVLAAGVVLFIASFLEYASDENAWSDFGIFTLPALIGLVAAAAVAVRAFTTVELPEPILTLTIDQLLLFLAFTALLIQVGLWFVIDNLAGDLGIGFWLGLLGSIALLAGTVMEQLALGGTASGPRPTAPPASPPTSF